MNPDQINPSRLPTPELAPAPAPAQAPTQELAQAQTQAPAPAPTQAQAPTLAPTPTPTQELAQAQTQAPAPAPAQAQAPVPPVEQQLPPPGDDRLSDGLRDLRFDTGDAKFAETYAARFRTRLNRRRTVARKAGTGFLQCRTFENPLEVLKKDFGARLR